MDIDLKTLKEQVFSDRPPDTFVFGFSTSQIDLRGLLALLQHIPPRGRRGVERFLRDANDDINAREGDISLYLDGHVEIETVPPGELSTVAELYPDAEEILINYISNAPIRFYDVEYEYLPLKLELPFLEKPVEDP